MKNIFGIVCLFFLFVNFSIDAILINNETPFELSILTYKPEIFKPYVIPPMSSQKIPINEITIIDDFIYVGLKDSNLYPIKLPYLAMNWSFKIEDKTLVVYDNTKSNEIVSGSLSFDSFEEKNSNKNSKTSTISSKHFLKGLVVILLARLLFLGIEIYT